MNSMNRWDIRRLVAGRQGRLRRMLTLIEYLVLMAYFAYLWLSTPSAEQVQAAQQVGNLIFAQFMGFFITVIIGSVFLERLGGWQMLLVTAVMGAFGFWLLLDLTTPEAAVVWIISILVGLFSNRENAFGNALASMLWLMFAGFLAALIGSMSGVPEGALLSTNLATVAGWGILYYAGMFLADWRYEKPQLDDSATADDDLPLRQDESPQ